MSDTVTVLLVLSVYLAFALGVGWLARRRGAPGLDDWFVASRRIGPVVLFCTLAATNFSAFFFLGFAGASYRAGFGFYGLMAFGTALVGASILLLGVPIHRLGKAKGYLTPPELVAGESGSRALGWLYAGVLVIFTLPYLAVQPMAAGLVLEQLTDGGIPYFAGATLMTGAMLIYLWLGGMRSSAWTDLVQGLLMLSLLAAAVAVVIHGLGGFGTAGNALWDTDPALFRREGNITPRVWLSYTLLWPLTVPMFPQLFSRFYIAESDRGLRTAAWLYPTVVPLLFLAPVLLGVLGHLDFPDLQGTESDSIVPLLLMEHAPLWLAAVVMVGAMAAFMSTADSQLLAMSSILTRDVAATVGRFVTFSLLALVGAALVVVTGTLWLAEGDTLAGVLSLVGVICLALAWTLLPREDYSGTMGAAQQLTIGRGLIVVLALAGLALAYDPPDTIFNIVSQAFTGLAVLFPTTVALLYWPRVRAGACIASIVAGEALVAWTYWLTTHDNDAPEWFAHGFHVSMPIVAVSAAVLAATHAVALMGKPYDES